MSHALDELADLAADLKAWLEWEQSLGAVSWPRERVPRRPIEPPASRPAQARPAQARPAQARPAQARPAQARPELPKFQPKSAAPKPSVRPSTPPPAPRVTAGERSNAESEWAEYAKPQPLAVGTGPTGAPLALIWTEGASPEAEAMLDRMLEGVLKIQRQDIAVITLARVRDTPENFRAALLSELDKLGPGLLLVMGTLGTRAVLGGSAEPAQSRADWHVLEGAAHMWAVRITHHPEHIRLKAASGEQGPRREAFEDLQAVAARL